MKERENKKAAAKQEKSGQSAKKALADMNLLDDFLFGSVVTCPEVGTKESLKII